MQRLFPIFVAALVKGLAPSAGDCGPSSISGVPGCWGTPACAYVISKDLGPAAACPFDYCNCGGTNVQLLPETISGTTTIGCASWTTQPSANDCPTSAPSVPYPSPSPDSASGSFSGRSQDGAPSRAGQTIVTGTLGSQTTTETFALTTISLLATLSSTVTSTTFDAHSSLQTLVIGPGGVAWAPIRPSSGAPDLPRPALPLPSRSLPGNSQTVTSAPNTGQPSAAVTSTAVQSTAFGAFDNPNQSETTIIVGGTTLHYSKETIQSLSTLTAPKTITTPLVQTNQDDSQFTVSAAVIIVGPGGSWWNGGTGGLGIHGSSCIWPFCPPGGGGDSDGTGSGKDPKDPNNPDSTEEPSDPNDDDDNRSKSSDDSSKTSSNSSPPSTSITTTESNSSGSSSSSSASPTASGQPCSPDCAVCNANPTKLKARVPRRGLSKRTRRPSSRNLSKRTLRTPANYGGNAMEFLLSEYAWAEWLDINGANGGPSTGFARSLTNRRYDAAVHGLFGCTSVVVVSRVGMWISHFWEIPSFRATAENWGHPRTAPDIANFNDHVIHQMQHGGNDIPGLTQFTAAGAEFAAAQRPVCAIVTPRGQAPNSWRYEPEVNAIKDVLNDLFPTSPPVIIDYEPRSDDNSQQTTASGKILFQYDPFQAMVTDPNNRCNVYQQAMFGLWVEDRPDYVLQQYWAAEANQLITDFSTYNPMRKRDGNPACKLPSNLPQASTLAKGEDMKPSIAPEPDETRWITLGTSTVASQISQSTVKESRMGQSSGPKTGISAAPATTSFIAANPSLLPSNTPLPSSKITPTSGGEAPAEPTKDACRKAGEDCFDDFDSCCSGLCSEDHGTGSLSCA